MGGHPLTLPPSSSCVSSGVDQNPNSSYGVFQRSKNPKPNAIKTTPHLLSGSNRDHITVGAFVESHLVLKQLFFESPEEIKTTIN